MGDTKSRLIRQNRDTKMLSDVNLDKLFSLPLVKKTRTVSRSVTRTANSTATATTEVLTVSSEPYRDCIFLHGQENGQERRMSCFKMDKEAQNFLLTCGIREGPNKRAFFLGDRNNDTSYILKVHNYPGTIEMVLMDINTGNQVWDRKDPDQSPHSFVLQPVVGRGFIAAPLIDSSFIIRIIDLTSGRLLRDINFLEPLEPFSTGGVCASGSRVMLTSQSTGHFWEELPENLKFKCFILDNATKKSSLPRKLLISKPHEEIDVSVSSFCGDNQAVSCLSYFFSGTSEPIDIRGLASVTSPKAFVIWNTDTGSTLRTVLVQDMDVAYCLGEFWILKRTDNSGEDKTLLELWTFNRSLALLSQLMPPEIRTRPVRREEKRRMQWQKYE